MQRIIWGTLAAAALAAALTGCDASFSASPSSSTQTGGSSQSSAPTGGSGTSTKTGTGTGTRPGGASGTRHCTTSDLHAFAYSNGDPGAGQRYGTLQLTNNSGTSCTTGGWSGLGLANANGALPTKVVREGTARTITIPAGASAYEQLHWGVVPGDGDDQGAQCQPTAKALHVIPPNQTTYISVSWIGGPVCQQGQIRLTPIKLGKL